MEKKVETTVKCPKCKSTDLLLIEIWSGHTITWEQKQNVIDRNDGNLESGDPYKVQAICSQCSHSWKVRGALQISDVVKA